jgi:hypothetical protein
MANVLLTIGMITREAVRLWRNTNAFLQHIDTQYDDSFAQGGAKIGTALRIRLPNDYTVRLGPAAQVQDTSEPSTTLVLATQRGVDVSFSSAERALSLDDYSKRILAPAVNNIAGAVAYDIMTGSEGGVSNITTNLSGTTLLSPNATTYLNSGAVLDNNSAPVGNRKIVNSPQTEANALASLAGLFNPQPTISKQYTTGRMQEALGFDWMKDQTVLTHTAGSSAVGAATVNGAGQTGLNLVVNALAGTFNQGDIINIAGVYQVNRITKQSTGRLRQFAVTANVLAGATTIPIYPAIVGPSANGAQAQYQTVASLPANGSAVNLAGSIQPSSQYVKNFCYVPEAITMATADLELPRGVHEAAREQYDGISMRMVTAYSIATDQFITRMDILYGYLYVRPEWAVVIADVVPTN